MNKYTRLPFLGLLKVSLLGVAFPLLLTSHNWAQANTKQNNSLLSAQTSAQSTPQSIKPAEVIKTNPPTQEKKQDLPWTVTAAAFGIVVVLYLGVLRFYPLLLLRLPAEVKIPKIGMFPEFKLPLGFVIWLKYRSRVLDAWVGKHIDIFQKKFLENETVDERKDYVSLPVLLNKQEIEELTAETLRESFAQEKRVRLLIWGEGGSGKTTIACQIAKWAMEKDKSKRLTTHLMLPVLIEEELDSQPGEGMKPLIEAIMGQIQELIDSEQTIVDELLVEQLLRQRRILLIVDHLSEMSKPTQGKINPNDLKFSANALIVTSRLEEKFQGIDCKIKTLRFDGGKLAYFIEQYLKKCEKWTLFEDEQEEFLQECAQLARIVGDKKTITVLLAKLYAERMINAKENSSASESSLDNIPDLIIDHLEKLNSQGEIDTRNQYPTVKEDAKVIAWKCLEGDYKPKPVKRESVVVALGGTNAEACLNYFENYLRLIKSIGYNNDQIRFALDPLAEYLAGLYLLEHYCENEVFWREFLAQAESKPQEEIKGFLLAVRECCIAKGSEAKVPAFVAEELGKLAGLDPEVLKQEQMKRRIRLLITNLSAPEANAEDRQRAAEEIGNIGSLAKSAVPEILRALKHEDAKVRGSAAEALGKLGNASDPVLEKLLVLLADVDYNVRANAAEALGILGNDSKPFLQGILYLLTDEVALVRRMAVEALGNLGNTSELVQQALLRMLTDDITLVRLSSCEALSTLGNTSEPLLQELLALMANKDLSVRVSASKVLYKLNTASELVLQGLLILLIDKELGVRLIAAEALGNLGNNSELVVYELLKLLKNQDFAIRASAAEALGKLGNNSKLVVRELQNLLSEEETFVLTFVAEALVNLGDTSELLQQKLNILLTDKSEWVREEADKALKKIRRNRKAKVLRKLRKYYENK
ncbi:HEAT repeat domain-containing protein [Nostoc sp. JL33]|uniref:HEAT repeat domain-containing protein n=1 Tax=Nostoc sp. JL33 TaxID=2815396 RepID=UPI0025EB3F87|nr:HEAT repeat domain-containing protein [Nostoc sp. JL33]MBN3871184.1 HEAT repeat domain-containing protein [Nostoc sp. JL33]